MGSEMHDHQVNKDAELEENKVQPAKCKPGDSEMVEKDEKQGSSNHDFAIDIELSRNGNSESSKEEKVCRICHFGSEASSGSSELYPIGCDCKGELGLSHRRCADAWFELKGNRLCEICGKTAENMRRNNNEEEASILMMEWINDMRLATATLDRSRDTSRSRTCKKSLWNIILVCLILAFVLPWFFRDMF
ncbi:hypothetical protein ABFS83_08G206800 [Erythranthe nasuta]